MSQWRCKADAGELGPVSFKELAELVREGKVQEGALVRREGASNWEPAWHVPGLFRAAGIVEPGDSPSVETGRGSEGETGSGSTWQGQETLPQRATPPPLTLANVARGIVAAGIGVLAVGFFYRWANQASLAFPMPPTVVDGELIDCYFPLVGRCTLLECALLYVDVFGVAAVATWHAMGRRGGSMSNEQ